MPVSPRDFELYSRMTGTSMPTDAISRARMAPEVYSFTRNFAKSPNILDKASPIRSPNSKPLNSSNPSLT